MSSVVYLPVASHQRLLLPLAAHVRAASVTTKRRAGTTCVAVESCVATFPQGGGEATASRDAPDRAPMAAWHAGRHRVEHAATE